MKPESIKLNILFKIDKFHITHMNKMSQFMILTNFWRVRNSNCNIFRWSAFLGDGPLKAIAFKLYFNLKSFEIWDPFLLTWINYI